MGDHDAKRRFSDRVADYIKYRPDYPASIVSEIETFFNISGRYRIADIGSGTGISSEVFLNKNKLVYGIEPNTDMRFAAEKRFESQSGFISIDGSAEDTGLPDTSLDLIISGQAFHWFDVVKCRKEFLNVLSAPKRVALFWNERLTNDTPFLQAYENFLLKHGTDYKSVNHATQSNNRFDKFFGNSNWELITLENEQIFDYQGLKGRLLSSSYVPWRDEHGFKPMIKDLEAIYEDYAVNDKVKLLYSVKLYLGYLGE